MAGLVRDDAELVPHPGVGHRVLVGSTAIPVVLAGPRRMDRVGLAADRSDRCPGLAVG